MKKNTGMFLLSLCPVQFYNVFILPILSQIMSNLSGSISWIYPQNKSIQSGLALENILINQCGFVWLCTMVAIGMASTNLWKLFHRGINIKHHDK